MAKRARHLRGEEELLTKRLTAQVVAGLLSELHEPPQWVYATEVRNATGWARRERYFDAFALHCWPSGGFARIAYEIKVSRSDFLSEMKAHHKRAEAMSVSNEFYFVTPSDVASEDEVPESCGLYHVVDTKDGWQLKKVKVAKHREQDVDSVPMSFVASLCRNVADTSMVGMRVFRIGERRVCAEDLFEAFRKAANTYTGGTSGPLSDAIEKWEGAVRDKVRKEFDDRLESFLDELREATGYQGRLHHAFQVRDAVEMVRGSDRVPARLMTAMRGAADLLEKTAGKLRGFVREATEEKED